MKKYLSLYVLFFLLLSSISFSQSPWKIGITGGYSYPTLFGDSAKSYAKGAMALPYSRSNISDASGFNVGAVLDYDMGKNFAIGAELLYQSFSFMQVFTFNSTFVDGPFINTNSTVNIQYIYLPILCKYNIPIFGSILSLFAGGDFGFLISGKNKKQITESYYEVPPPATSVVKTSNNTEDIKDSLNTLNFTLKFGFRLSWDLNKNFEMFLQSVYDYPFMNIYMKNSDLKFSIISINWGVLMKL